MRILENRFFIIAVCVALILTILPTVWAVMGRTDILTSALNTAAVPFRFIGSKIGEGFRGIGAYFTSVGRLLDENRQLKAENESLRQQLFEQKKYEFENRNIRAFIHMDSTYDRFQWASAKVVAITERYWVLNSGSEAGIEKNMPVVDASGAVGMVIASGLGWAHIQPLHIPGLTISAYVLETSDLGQVTATIGLSANRKIRISQLPETAEIHIGDTVVSSGYGSVWPEGFLIGSVTDVQYDANSRSPVATVEPAANLLNPALVMVLIGGRGEA